MKPFNKARSIAEYFDVPTLAEEYLNVYIFGVLVHDKKIRYLLLLKIILGIL